MAGGLRRRVERLEQTANPPPGQLFGICFLPADCPDPMAWEEEASAKARQDGVQALFVVKFLMPGASFPAA